MSDVDAVIRRDIEDDVTIKVKALAVEIRRKGVFPRRRFLYVGGIVPTEHAKAKIDHIAHHHAGDAYRVVNDVQTEDTAGS